MQFRELQHIHLLGFISAAAYGWLCWLSWQHSEISLGGFYAVMACSAACMLLGYRVSRNSTRISLKLILFWAVVFRLIGLMGLPVLEDDYYRYLWDAFQFAQTGTPYGVAPESHFNSPDPTAPFDDILGSINYPEVATIYGPSNQYLFLLAYGLKPGSVFSLKLLMIIIDLILIWRLAALSHISLVLLYAWSPLVIKEVAFTAHPDGFGAALVFFSFDALKQRYFWQAGALMALAVGAKIFAYLLLPFLIWRRSWRVVAGFMLGFVLLYLPFVLQDGSELDGLKVFAEHWQFNAALFGVVSNWLTPQLSKLILGLSFVSCLFVYWIYYQRKTDRPIPRADLIFGAFLLIAPVINSWYFLWVLPFAVIYPSLWAWGGSLALLLSYATGFNLNDSELEVFEIPFWLQVLEYTTIAVLLVLDLWLYKKLRTSQKIKSTHSEPASPAS